MSERALMRRLRRYENQAVNTQGGGQYMPLGGLGGNPRELLDEQQDRQRLQLAEQTLLALVDSYGWDSSEQLKTEAKGDLEELAKAALAAATVIYPELPDEEGA